MMVKYVILISFVICHVHNASGIFMAPSPVPLTRIIQSTDDYLKKNPKDANAYYIKGRAYYLAFYNQATIVQAFERRTGGLPGIAPQWMIGDASYLLIQQEAQKRALKNLNFESVSGLSGDDSRKFYKEMNKISDQLRKEKWKPKKLSKKEVEKYVSQSRENFLKAIQLSKDNPLYYLGLASLYDQSLQFDKDLSSEITREKMLNLYWKAFVMAKGKDESLKHRPPSGIMSLVSFEAGKAYLKNVGEDEKKRQTINEHLQKLEKLPIGAITPLVITRPHIKRAEDYVVRNAPVTFDLNGNGFQEKWDWVTPETGVLVWDPLDTRRVISGRQLFGNYTFQIFWKDGFHAIDSLDVDRNNKISDIELNGISVWFDHNSDGISNVGEVTPIEELGIKSLSLDSIEFRDGMKVRMMGVKYLNGASGNLWDWISHSHKIK